MVNILKIQQQQNQELLNKIADLKKKLADKEKVQEFEQLNNEEIREWIINILSNDYSASDMDAKAIDAVMYHCNQENWSKFCEWNPTEAIRRNMIIYTYKFNHYWNLTGKLYSERNDARYHILVNFIKLNSEESKGLFRKWISESKLEDTITTQRILENGYEEDWKSCYSYLDLRHLSLDELISSWNEITVNAFKQKQEYSEKVAELESKNTGLEMKVNEKDNQIEELEERVDIEIEMNLKALDKAKEWRERQLKEKTAGYIANERKLLDRIKVLENNINWLENKEQIIKKYEDKELPALPKKQKQSKSLKLKKLVSKVKEKTQEKFQTFIVQKSK